MLGGRAVPHVSTCRLCPCHADSRLTTPWGAFCAPRKVSVSTHGREIACARTAHRGRAAAPKACEHVVDRTPRALDSAAARRSSTRRSPADESYVGSCPVSGWHDALLRL